MVEINFLKIVKVTKKYHGDKPKFKTRYGLIFSFINDPLRFNSIPRDWTNQHETFFIQKYAKIVNKVPWLYVWMNIIKLRTLTRQSLLFIMPISIWLIFSFFHFYLQFFYAFPTNPFFHFIKQLAQDYFHFNNLCYCYIVMSCGRVVRFKLCLAFFIEFWY